MKRIIDFQVSIGGKDTVVERVEYESSFSSFEEIRKLPYLVAGKVMEEAIEALKKKIGHDDYNIIYWYWIT